MISGYLRLLQGLPKMCVRHSRERVLRKVLLLWDERCVDISLPPENEVYEGYVFTGVCLSTEGVSVSGPWRVSATPLHTTTLGRQPCVDTPLGRPPWADTPWADTPGQTPLLGRHPPRPVHAGDTHSLLLDTTGYGQQAGGTHPTGMHSCDKN